MVAYAVLNQKGGVGKTTLSLNLGHAWASRGLRVLIVDVDKQAAATASLVAAELSLEQATLSDVLREPGVDLDRAVMDADPAWAGVQLVPASLDLEDVWASQRPGLVFRLRRALDVAGAHERWDRIILDGPPDLGPGTVAACVAADAIIVPTRPERMAMQGVARTVETVGVVRRDMRPDVELAGIVPVAVDTRVIEHAARIEEMRRVYGYSLTGGSVPHRLKSDEASGAGLPAADLRGDAGTVMAKTYASLADELDDRMGVTERAR